MHIALAFNLRRETADHETATRINLPRNLPRNLLPQQTTFMPNGMISIPFVPLKVHWPDATASP